MKEWTDWHEKHSDKIELVAGVDCWIWTACQVNGYGRVSYKRKAEFAHRAAFIEAGGTFDDGNVVRHMCGNSMCVRPGHLKAGTHLDNSRDRTDMFQTPSGLIEADIVGIRIDYRNGLSLATISEKYGIAYGSVLPIVCGKSFSRIAQDLITPNGVRVPRKLDKAAAQKIKTLLAKGYTQPELARMFGVKPNTISRIKTGARWGLGQSDSLQQRKTGF